MSTKSSDCQNQKNEWNLVLSLSFACGIAFTFIFLATALSILFVQSFWLSIVFSCVFWLAWAALSLVRYKIFFRKNIYVFYSMLSLFPFLIAMIICLYWFFEDNVDIQESLINLFVLGLYTILANGLLNGIIDYKVRKNRKLASAKNINDN